MMSESLAVRDRPLSSGGRRAFAAGTLLAAVAVAFIGLTSRPPLPANQERMDVRDLAVVWVAEEAGPLENPASGVTEKEVLLDDGLMLVEGWLRVTAEPFNIELTGSTAIEGAAGFSYARADLPSAEGARAFSIVFRPHLDEQVPICVVAVMAGERHRLSTPSCP
jgi:hypothetical protein